MTQKTATLGIRLEINEKEQLAEYITRKSLMSILEQINKGEIRITDKGVDFIGVNTISESVNTCEDCPYMDDLDLAKFNEVCDFKNLDRQKALDRCVQMLWR